MGAGWVAGGVRARALLARRVGSAGAGELAAGPTLATAVRTLSAGPYGRAVAVGQTLAEAEHAVAATVLWNLRVLAGWQPREGAEVVRLLAGWFELANIVERAGELAGRRAGPLFDVGRLGTSWSRLAPAGSPGELRNSLAATPWGDPGAATPAAVAVSTGVSWALRVSSAVPEAGAWAAGGAALLVARQRFLTRHQPAAAVASRAAVLLGAAATANTWDGYLAGLPRAAAWPVADLTDPEDLWGAETRWWTRVERDAGMLTGASLAGRAPIVGCVALLAADARRVRAALQLAERGGLPTEAVDALA